MSIFRRLFRRGPDTASTDALIALLTERRVGGRPAEDAEAIASSLRLPRGTRAIAVVELGDEAAPLRHVVASRLGGEAAGHMGKITVTGIHVTLDRSSLPAEWPSGWSTPLLAQPQDRGSFSWRSLDATAAGASDAAALLSASDRIARLVNVILNEPRTLQVEIAPSGSSVRVAAHHTGGGLPPGTTLEAVLGIARGVAGVEV